VVAFWFHADTSLKRRLGRSRLIEVAGRIVQMISFSANYRNRNFNCNSAHSTGVGSDGIIFTRARE